MPSEDLSRTTSPRFAPSSTADVYLAGDKDQELVTDTVGMLTSDLTARNVVDE